MKIRRKISHEVYGATSTACFLLAERGESRNGACGWLSFDEYQSNGLTLTITTHVIELQQKVAHDILKEMNSQ